MQSKLPTSTAISTSNNKIRWKGPKRRKRYHVLRDALINDMGGRCEQCGTAEKLEFNHKYGKCWEPRMICFYNRMLRYRREFEAGELNLLCKSCNYKYWPVARTAEGELCPF
jgi:hypothetical protein